MSRNFLLLFLIPILFSCSPHGEFVESDFSNLLEGQEGDRRETIGVFGGARQEKIANVQWEGVSFKVNNSAIALNFSEDGYFRFTPESAGLPVSWKNSQKLVLNIHSSTPSRLVIEVFGSRTRTHDTLRLEKGKNEYTVAMKETGLLGGLDAKPTYLKVSSAEAVECKIEWIRLYFSDAPEVLVDRFGQRNLASYPEKVKTQEELIEREKEVRYLDSLSATPGKHQKDKYGGYKGTGILLDATGFFTTQLKDGRWYLVTPEGNPFFSLGINGVRRKSFRGTADVTRVEGREAIFEHLPSYQECPECFFNDSTYFSHYTWNIKQKYEDYDQWRAHTIERMKTIGFNTVGNWSDTLFFHEPEIPYTFTLDTRGASKFTAFGNLPDVFHPQWVHHVDSVFAGIQHFSNDPYLLGYFVDNEMSWRDIPRIDSMSYTGRELKNIPGDEAKMEWYAERYFSVISAAIRKYDPNHLYLGCRFTRNFDHMEGVAQKVGKYADVLSVNVYSAYPFREEMDLWYDAAKKPILIGEHHIPPRTPKQLWPVYENFPDHERYDMIENYVLTWASYPYAVGSHWYQFKDQEVAGRGDGGENQPVGIITIADKLNRDLCNTYFRISQKVPEKIDK
ncbi:MAG: hypothetical protein RIC19_11540 [Phaeodactylibacter sp.]|uniref:hypothetical protein n=1 Tax=Phaeodactylibacter sp. TaxID=1940289 RepID=UPI0032F090E1